MSVVSYQLSVISYQLSVVSYQLSVVRLAGVLTLGYETFGDFFSDKYNGLGAVGFRGHAADFIAKQIIEIVEERFFDFLEKRGRAE